MEKNNNKSSLIMYMWHIGRFLTEIMIISDSTESPIIVETFDAAAKLFDTLGRCIYSSLSYDNIFPELTKFIESLDYDSKSSFDSILEYAYEFSRDFLAFLEEHNLKK